MLSDPLLTPTDLVVDHMYNGVSELGVEVDTACDVGTVQVYRIARGVQELGYLIRNLPLLGVTSEISSLDNDDVEDK